MDFGKLTTFDLIMITLMVIWIIAPIFCAGFGTAWMIWGWRV
jgi:hypothetical protein